MKRGTIVLVPFPFTDLSGQKLRPALVVSRSDRPGSDVVLAFITTYHDLPLLKSDLLIEKKAADFFQTGLKTSSIVKSDKLVTVDTAILLGELGELPSTWLQQVDKKLRYVLDL